MLKNKLPFYFLLIFFIAACNKKFDSAKEMTAFLNDDENGYCYKRSINEVDFNLTYKPTDLLVEQEIGEKRSNAEIEKLRMKYEKYLYFTLSMSQNKQELLSKVAHDNAKFGRLVNDLAFKMEDKIHLCTPNRDTLIMADFIYPRMFGMSQSTEILVAYPKGDYLENEYLNFIIEDIGFDTGDIKFKINTKPLRKEPQLTF